MGYRWRKSSLVGVVGLLCLWGPVTPLSGGEPDSSPGFESSSGGRNGIPTGLQKDPSPFRMECGLLVNSKSEPALQPFFDKERPRQGRDRSSSHSPSPSKVFLALLAEIFNLPLSPCP